jgi:hypothetical protein
VTLGLGWEICLLRSLALKRLKDNGWERSSGFRRNRQSIIFVDKQYRIFPLIREYSGSLKNSVY